MKKFIIGATALLTTLTGAMAAAPAAEAGDWRGGGYHGGYGYRGGYGHRGGGAGPAIVAGIAGLAVGAALAGHHHDYDYDYGRRSGYGYAYGPGVYPGPVYYGYYGCHREWVWGRWGGYHLVEVCD